MAAEREPRLDPVANNPQLPGRIPPSDYRGGTKVASVRLAVALLKPGGWKYDAMLADN